MRAVSQGEWDWLGEQEQELAGAGSRKDRHGEVRAHSMADLQWSGSGQRREVRLDANTGRVLARTRGKCPAKSFIWQALGIAKLENQPEEICIEKDHCGGCTEN